MTDRIGQQLGLYRLIRFIGRGSFAEVYLGEHVRMLTQAVVKVFQLQLTREEEERFGEEVRVLKRLGHPHLMPLLDGSVHDSTPFVVTDYAPNGTLRGLFPPGTPQAPGTILPYVWQVADALHFAHGQRVLHRNVKPENMLLGANNEVLLSDFSIPVLSQSPRYQAALERTGIAAYLAPEHIRGQATPASDQYALAAIIYEWLCGSPPFQGTITEVMAKHLFSEVPPLRERVRTLSPAIEAVVLGALSKDPADRFPSVESFARAFEEASQAVPVLLFVPPVLIESAQIAEAPMSAAATGPIVAQGPALATPKVTSAPLAMPPAASPVTSGPLAPPPDAPKVTSAPLATPPNGPAAPEPRLQPAEPQPIITPPPARPTRPAESQPIITPPPALPPASSSPPAAPPSAPIFISAPSAVRPETPAAPIDMPAPAFTVPGRPRAAVSAPMQPGQPANPVSVSPVSGPHTPPRPAPVDHTAQRPPLDATWREVNWIPTPSAPTAAPKAPPPEPPRQGISRRTFLVGGALGMLAGVGILTWLGVNALEHQHSPGANTGSGPKATPKPTSTPTPTPVPQPGDTVYTYHGHSGVLRSVAWSPDGKRIASASDDGTVQVWDAFTGTNPFTYSQHTAPVMAVAWSPDGTQIASGSQDKSLHVWDASSGQTLHTFTFDKQVMAIAWSPKGAYLAAASWDETLTIWDAKTWERLHHFDAGAAINTLSWSPDNIHVVSGDDARQATVWNVETGGRIRTYHGQTSAVLALAWSPSGTGIASGADLPDMTLQYWNSVTLNQVWSIPTQGATPALAWSPSGMQLAAGGSGVSLLNPANGVSMLTYSQAAATLAWSPDGTHIASGGQPTTVQVWLATA